MAIYQPKDPTTGEIRSKVYVMDFHFAGQRIRESTRTRSKTLAQKIEDKRRRGLEEQTAGIRKQQAPQLLSIAAEEYLAAKGRKKGKKEWSPKMLQIQKNSLAHLSPVLGKKLVIEIEPSDIAAYQEQRTKEGAAGRTVNIEIATLRAILKAHKQWDRVRDDVGKLEEREDVGRAIGDDEERALLLECSRSRARILFPFVLLALETGARYNTIRTLRWGNVDFANRCLKFGRDKTAAGTNRTVPLNQRALENLKFWAQQFPNRKPEHYVFPSEKVGASGDSFDAKVYDTEPSNPIGNIKESWEAAKKRTRRHCPSCKTGILADKPKPKDGDAEKGYTCVDCHFETPELPTGLVAVRFHDLRHTAVTRMIAAGIPLPMIAKIVGWSAGTMAKMAARYGHFGMEELRGAMETISRPAFEIPEGSPHFSPHPGTQNVSHRAN
jgi:integrase